MADTETQDRLLALMGKHPGQGLTTEDLVRLSGVTRQRVHQVLKEAGYEVRCVWVKGKGKRA